MVSGSRFGAGQQRIIANFLFCIRRRPLHKYMERYLMYSAVKAAAPTTTVCGVWGFESIFLELLAFERCTHTPAPNLLGFRV